MKPLPMYPKFGRRIRIGKILCRRWKPTSETGVPLSNGADRPDAPTSDKDYALDFYPRFTSKTRLKPSKDVQPG